MWLNLVEYFDRNKRDEEKIMRKIGKKVSYMMHIEK